MRVGNLIRFSKHPTKNTPGARELNLQYPDQTGVIMGDRYFERDGVMLNDDPWCDVLWSNAAVTRCYKNDLQVME